MDKESKILELLLNICSGFPFSTIFCSLRVSNKYLLEPKRPLYNISIFDIAYSGIDSFTFLDRDPFARSKLNASLGEIICDYFLNNCDFDIIDMLRTIYNCDTSCHDILDSIEIKEMLIKIRDIINE